MHAAQSSCGDRGSQTNAPVHSSQVGTARRVVRESPSSVERELFGCCHGWLADGRERRLGSKRYALGVLEQSFAGGGYVDRQLACAGRREAPRPGRDQHRLGVAGEAARNEIPIDARLAGAERRKGDRVPPALSSACIAALLPCGTSSLSSRALISVGVGPAWPTTALPVLSTATQSDTEAHDTPSSESTGPSVHAEAS